MPTLIQIFYVIRVLEPAHTDLTLFFIVWWNKFENEFAEVFKLGWLKYSWDLWMVK